MTTGTLSDLVAMEGMPSLPSLQRFIAAHPAFPVLERGRLGRPYRLDLDQAAAYVRAHWQDRRRRAVEDAGTHAAVDIAHALPTPASVDDRRIGSLSELGAMSDMPSLPALQKFIGERPDFPILVRGRYGVRYQFDLDEAASFVRKHWRDGRRRTPAAEQAFQFERDRQAMLPGLEHLKDYKGQIA